MYKDTGTDLMQQKSDTLTKMQSDFQAFKLDQLSDSKIAQLKRDSTSQEFSLQPSLLECINFSLFDNSPCQKIANKRTLQLAAGGMAILSPSVAGIIALTGATLGGIILGSLAISVFSLFIIFVLLGSSLTPLAAREQWKNIEELEQASKTADNHYRIKVTAEESTALLQLYAGNSLQYQIRVPKDDTVHIAEMHETMQLEIDQLNQQRKQAWWQALEEHLEAIEKVKALDQETKGLQKLLQPAK